MTVRIYRDKEFELLEGVYDPGDDSFLLVEAALKDIRAGEKVLEVGTGSGVVSFFVKDVTRVIATDINPIACQNARLNGVEVVRTDLFSGICGQFDVIIFNPPYLPTSEDEKLDTWLNRAFDGGPDGRDVIRQFLAGVKRILPIGGRVLTVFSSLTDIDAVAELYRQHGFSVETVAREKVPFEVLVVFKCVRLS
ncbi:HemK2/MTQ2 family protein methyltransferase [Methanocella arvoryzae]|uniref:Protoporphyrinogen oxidase-related protein (HemK-like) n=1 Tax=Methanocella arvoryzae (strain DSM 22066 / NBRC 105507 / MRE50) TaxID=351160 RepID=Q0W2E5_METAR|nr:HemK2/MTQ2 family protein methyltransferase [Methanocella arvoryzae]CAJ37448.1 protoporphyrinogen oxidase-related protein (HemK-like) [Methanocella arvoryzae MRE50]